VPAVYVQATQTLKPACAAIGSPGLRPTWKTFHHPRRLARLFGFGLLYFRPIMAVGVATIGGPRDHPCGPILIHGRDESGFPWTLIAGH